MKRKGFLKNIIGALCVGVLMSMPVTVNAAEKEDVLGTWTGRSCFPVQLSCTALHLHTHPQQHHLSYILSTNHNLLFLDFLYSHLLL